MIQTDEASVSLQRATAEPPAGGARIEEPVFISQSPAIKELRSRISLVARSEASVLITGESGSGKEIIARLIHFGGPRISHPFVAVNCAAMPREVVDNELFGHEREAFTGATSKRCGCFEMAEGGTLFLDEIAEMHVQSQAKLLRAIESKSFRRLGGKDEVSVDVRVTAATNRDVAAAIKSGELREDLYYRLSVIELHLPALRERREDIPLLAEYYLDYFARKYNMPRKSFTSESMDALSAYDWPGNVREFKNMMERTVLVCPHDEVERRCLPERLLSSASHSGAHVQIPVGVTLEEGSNMLITKTLAAVGGNKARAARILGISRKALYNKLRGARR
ncbi:MAG TPA: sigma-54 dependent transcriptional regulator [Bacteroidota bacterium]|nr:sigma-54 dependent transcriptional regulator [Bacteroidota bacterium]